MSHFIRRGTAGAQPFPSGAHAPAGPGLAPPLRWPQIACVTMPPFQALWWNNIPAFICDSGTLSTFKIALKTHLFNSAYTSCHWQPQRLRFTPSWLMASIKKYLWLI